MGRGVRDRQRPVSLHGCRFWGLELGPHVAERADQGLMGVVKISLGEETRARLGFGELGGFGEGR